VEEDGTRGGREKSQPQDDGTEGEKVLRTLFLAPIAVKNTRE
jgi:hypothetical protein